jgi:hypothetical protein
MMDDKRLQEIKARAEAATPGEWECRIDVGNRFYVSAPSYGVRDFCCLSGGFERREDAELTAHARTDIPDLIAEVERLRAELEAARGDMRALSDEYKFCNMCKYHNGEGVDTCSHPLRFSCDAENFYEWRGVTEN